MQPASTPAPAQTGSNTNNLVLTSEERIRIRQRLFTKLLAMSPTTVSPSIVRARILRTESCIWQRATSRHEYLTRVAEWLSSTEKSCSAHKCQGPEWKLRLTINKRRKVYEHIRRLLTNMSMTAPARDHLQRAANMYELFAFSKATSGPQYLALVANGLACLENGGTWFSSSWQNDIPWVTRSKVRTHIVAKLGPKLHRPCSAYSHVYQTHPDIPLTFENKREASQNEPCAVLIESHAFVTASSHMKYLERVADGICNVQNGRPWNDLGAAREITTDERDKVRTHVINKLTERNALEALPKALKQRVKSFESDAFRQANSRTQYFERIADGLNKYEACTTSQPSECQESKEYIGTSARTQCRDFVEANLKTKVLFPIHPEPNELRTLADSLEEEVFKCATTMAEYIDLLNVLVGEDQPDGSAKGRH